MSDLTKAIAGVRSRVARFQSSRRINEENTKASLIDPILRALGWNTEETDEVQREYKMKSTDKPVDYALILARRPRLFIEAKALGENLDDRKWANQIMGYAAVAGVEWIALTDGDKWRLYNAHAAVAVEDKLFREFRISDSAAITEDTLRLLARDGMGEPLLQTLWRVQFIDRRVQRSIEELVADADTELLKLVVRGSSGLTEKDVRASLVRARIAVTFPVDTRPLPNVKQGSRVADRAAHRDSTPTIRLAKSSASKPRAGVTLSDLIAAGILSAPLELRRRFKGVDVRARVDADGSVIVDGQRTQSLSTAGGIAIARVRGVDPASDSVATDGWSFWRFVDSDQAERPIHALRERYLKRRGIGAGQIEGSSSAKRLRPKP
ncbi:MAG: type I restriction enzyme HsdR N-terminal domain-containing protein [Planctomycetes bacterium]|nr:type I restriction enzyme HsdR N-terminal domain-containing protein [Planctomycetota bacterium]